MDSVNICNLALNMIGIPPIASFSENNNNAKLCERFYPVMRDKVLRDHTWSFATYAMELPQLAEKPFDPNYSFAFQLPGDLLRIIELIPREPYRKVRNMIFANVPVTCVYIKKVEDPELFDVTFVEALQYLLAAEIGLANTKDGNLIAYYRQQYEKSLAIARSIDSQENFYNYQQREETKSSFIAARFRG